VFAQGQHVEAYFIGQLGEGKQFLHSLLRTTVAAGYVGGRNFAKIADYQFYKNR